MLQLRPYTDRCKREVWVDPKNILAHRGWWTEPEDKNSFRAFERALNAGFGIETDFRDRNGTLVVSHDPPDENALKAEDFFELYARIRGGGRLALNIKADGLQKLMAEHAASLTDGFQNIFAFDMSVPDTLGYLAINFPVYTRISEYERNPPFLDRAIGVWVDNFTGTFPQIEAATKLLASGHRVCIVSPELHRRDHESLWSEIARAGLHTNPLFELCTDLPQDAYERLGA